MLRPLLALFALIAFLVLTGCSSGCGHIKVNPDAAAMKIDVEACAKGAVPEGLTALADQALLSLTGATGAPSWETFSETTLLGKGIEAGECALEAAWHDMHVTFGAVHGQVMPAYQLAAKRRQDWLKKHGLQPASSASP